MMKNKLLDLQYFAEGGSAGAGTASGGEGSGAGDSAQTGVADQTGSEDLSNVVYGKPSGEIANPKQGNTAKSQESLEASFQEMIKGEYKDIYAKRTQAMIDDRFKKYKGMETRMNSLSPILQTLSEKYGTNPDDIEALSKAIDEDDSFYQQAAMDAGLTVKQYKQFKALERQNAELENARKAQEAQQNQNRIYAMWQDQGKQFAEKYGIQNFSLQAEAQNPEFVKLLKSGVGVEGAYKAIHFDDMVGGAMAHTAEKVRTDLVQSINGRKGRPAENATMTQSAVTMKTDVNSLTKADREEIERRALRGETIRF